MQNVLTKVGLSVVTALAGGAAWMVAEPGARSVLTMLGPKGEVVAVAVPTAAPGGAGGTGIAPDLSLATAMTGLVEIAKAANRPETVIVGLTAASVKLGELNNKIAGLGPADGAARDLLAENIKETALGAARAEITAVSAEVTKVAAAIRNDFKVAESELSSVGKALDPDSLAAKTSAVEAEAAVIAAVETAKGEDAAAALAAASTVEQSLVKLNSLRPAASAAFIKGKRASFDTSIGMSRTLAQDIATTAANIKKPGVMASREKKNDAKYLADTDAWARSRVAELELLVPKLSSASRSNASAYATQASTTMAELKAALENCKASASRLQ